MQATNRLEQFPRGSSYENYGDDVDNENDMPNRLFWRPICDNDDPLDNQLKYILIEQDMLDNKMLTTKELSFLKGIKAAALFLNHKEIAASAEKIIEAIETFGHIQLYEG